MPNRTPPGRKAECIPMTITLRSTDGLMAELAYLQAKLLLEVWAGMGSMLPDAILVEALRYSRI
jgi:hypothetical protein